MCAKCQNSKGSADWFVCNTCAGLSKKLEIWDAQATATSKPRPKSKRRRFYRPFSAASTTASILMRQHRLEDDDEYYDYQCKLGAGDVSDGEDSDEQHRRRAVSRKKHSAMKMSQVGCPGCQRLEWVGGRMAYKFKRGPADEWYRTPTTLAQEGYPPTKKRRAPDCWICAEKVGGKHGTTLFWKCKHCRDSGGLGSNWFVCHHCARPLSYYWEPDRTEIPTTHWESDLLKDDEPDWPADEPTISEFKYDIVACFF